MINNVKATRKGSLSTVEVNDMKEYSRCTEHALFELEMKYNIAHKNISIEIQGYRPESDCIFVEVKEKNPAFRIQIINSSCAVECAHPELRNKKTAYEFLKYLIENIEDVIAYERIYELQLLLEDTFSSKEDTFSSKE